MRRLLNFIHRLLDPYCDGCRICHSCEVLRLQVADLIRERDMLLRSIIDKPSVIPEPVRPKFAPWSVRRQMLEEEDRRRLEQSRSSIRKNEELEEEILEE